MQSGITIRGYLRSTAMAAAGAIVLSLGSPLLSAQVSSYGYKETGPTNDRPPTLLNGVGIDQHLNTQLPLNLAFTDDAGNQVT
ncbi:MAG: SCO family protein, partial [Terracidiphilus sp.]